MNFPVNFPVSSELGPESGSLETPSTAISHFKTSQEGRFVSGRRSACRPVGGSSPQELGGVSRRRAWAERVGRELWKIGKGVAAKWVVRPRRFELLAYSFGGCRSIHLSYGRIFGINHL